ncbi:MAG: hypothetical protein B7Y80_12785 [Hyphomicrobium sp. 32-62-53]|nr:MAG: hypothetical protein B7Y80_12785 [Hyphomicrobium sp. 32-62-53]
MSLATRARFSSVTKTETGSVIGPGRPFGPSRMRPEKPYFTVTRPGSTEHSRAVLVISPRCMTAIPSPTRPCS